MSAPRDFTITFAGAGTQELKARGRLIRVLEAPASHVWIEVQGGSELKRRDGQGVNFSPDFFTVVRVRSEVAQTVRLVVADEPQDDDRNAVSVTATASIAPANTLDAGGDVSIPALSSNTLAAADTTRKALIVTNPVSNAREVRVGGSGVAAASGVRLEPGDSIIIETTAIIAAYNPDTAAQSLNVLPVRQV